MIYIVNKTTNILNISHAIATHDMIMIVTIEYENRSIALRVSSLKNLFVFMLLSFRCARVARCVVSSSRASSSLLHRRN